MAGVNSFVAQRLPPYTKPEKPYSFPVLHPTKNIRKYNPSDNLILSVVKRRRWSVGSVSEDQELVRLEENYSDDREQGLSIDGSEKFESYSSSTSSFSEEKGADEVFKGFSGRAINATIVLGFGTLVVTKLLTIDHELWHVSFLACCNFISSSFWPFIFFPHCLFLQPINYIFAGCQDFVFNYLSPKY